ncbi:hypothetical protein MM236_06155 [Belliella sp. DSM 107340]|uniref:Uncharacterized protein n=1 Tax=Belliella calami TaxID=2923436 RepID=A0ABS9ULR4_9BACT|nr:hypothetical protein [Belliella calami]MCH7397561.1 hypothetical protein [Belliella calami]
MTKIKYEIEGGSGFRIFHPFAKLEQKKKQTHMKQTLLILTLLLSLNTFGQTGQKNFIDQNYIEVNGTSEIEVSPDKIIINIIINEKDHKGKTVNDVEKLMVDKLKAL